MTIIARDRDGISPVLWIPVGVLAVGVATAAITPYWGRLSLQFFGGAVRQVVKGDIAPLRLSPNGRMSPAPVPPTPTATMIIPAFDVVRAERSGEAVVAGRAQPRSKILLLSSGVKLAEATADANGQFVMIPPPFEPGHYRLSLRQINGQSVANDGQNEVALEVARHADREGRTEGRLSTTENKSIGRAVRSSVTQKSATSQLDRTAMGPPSPSNVPLDAPSEQPVPVVVVRGDSLWNISRARLGSPLRYPQIFAANAKQIRDPNLIYPGQVLSLPKR